MKTRHFCSLPCNERVWTVKCVKWERDLCLKNTAGFLCHIQQTKRAELEQRSKREPATV